MLATAIGISLLNSISALGVKEAETCEAPWTRVHALGLLLASGRGPLIAKAQIKKQSFLVATGGGAASSPKNTFPAAWVLANVLPPPPIWKLLGEGLRGSTNPTTHRASLTRLLVSTARQVQDLAPALLTGSWGCLRAWTRETRQGSAV